MLIKHSQPGTSFLSTAYEAHYSGERYFVYISVDVNRKDNTGYWRIRLAAQNPCSHDVKNPTITVGGGAPIGSGVQAAGGRNTEGDINPRWLPILVNTQFTVTLINNDEWVRTENLNIDDKEEFMDAQVNKAISKAFSTKTGKVSILMFDSQSGVMRPP